MRRPNSPVVTVEMCLRINSSSLVASGVADGKPGDKWLIEWTTSERQRIGRAAIVIQECDELGSRVELAFYLLRDGQTDALLIRQQIKIVRMLSSLYGSRRLLQCDCTCRGPCERRVSNLYFAPGSSVFKCKHCASLTCESERHLKRRRPRQWQTIGKLQQVLQMDSPTSWGLPESVSTVEATEYGNWPGIVYDREIQERSMQKELRMLTANARMNARRRISMDAAKEEVA